jgi:hypothetical protein
MVMTTLSGATSNGKDEISASLELMVTGVRLVHDETCLFKKFSLCALKVGLTVLTMPLGKRPLVTQSSTNKKNFSEIIHNNTTVYLHMTWLVALKSRWHRGNFSVEHFACEACGLFQTVA